MGLMSLDAEPVLRRINEIKMKNNETDLIPTKYSDLSNK